MSMSYEPPAGAQPGGYPQPGQPPAPGQPAIGGLQCPKCRGAMRTYERNGVHVDQCETCRGIFLDFGELEALTKIESRLSQAAAPAPAPQPQQPVYPAAPPQAYPQSYPPAYGHGPAWGHHGSHYYHRGGLARLFFSS